MTARPRRAVGRLRVVLVALALASVGSVAPVIGRGVPAAMAADGDIGTIGPSYAGAGTGATGSKPQSKLWWNDGSWWGSLWSPASSDFHVFRLDAGTRNWIDTGVALDDRPSTRADTLWDGTHLYVASHRFSSTNATGYPSRLYRYSYDGVARTYHLDAGFPVAINDVKSETLVIDKDSTGTLWATWTQGSTVFVNHTVGGDDRAWRTPYALPVAGALAAADDISSVIAFGGDRIGVMWSNQLDSKVYFAIHVDGASDTVWDASRTAIQGPGTADDHISLKSAHTTADGRVFAAIKTSHTSGSAPRIMLLVRAAGTGDWSNHVIARVSDGHTRPIILIDEQNRRIHVFLTGPEPPSTSGESGGTIYEKVSDLDAISFTTGVGSAVIRDVAAPTLNDVTSTKQNVDGTTGLVVLAGNDATDRYWHHQDPLATSTTPPVADFGAAPMSGPAPLPVTFTDRSTGSPTAWSWDFGDGTGSTAQHPTHTYPTPGTYTVSLTVTNANGSDTLALPTPIDVGPPASVTTLAPAADAYVNLTYPTRNYGSDAQLRARSGYRSHVRFDVPGLSGAVTRATLRLFVNDPTLNVVTAAPTDPGWGESTITWDTAPPATGPGAMAAPASLGTWQEFDVTTAVAGPGLVSFVISNDGTDSVYYSSREGAAAPQLVVETASGAPTAPTADFTATPVSGTAPFLVTFRDISTGLPDQWSWDFGDGQGSTLQHPTHSYAAPGTYTVSLAVSNALGSDELVRSDLVTVAPAPLVTTLLPVADARLLQSSPTKNYGSDVTLRVRQHATGSSRSLIRFDVPALQGPVTSVKLRLWCSDGSSNGGVVHQVDPGWTEGTVTWASAPPIAGDPVVALGPVVTGQWVEVDVTAAVVLGQPFSVSLSGGVSNSALYHSREAAQPPQLVISR